MSNGADSRVDAHPEKHFFVDMLTRDIELAPAIIDLVDNSIDGAKRLRPDETDDRYRDLWVKLRLDPDTFEIVDSCGGFDRHHAETYAFKFGRRPDQPGTPGEVGQFGVGMKRAIFKIGREFTVACTTNGDSWQVEVDVDDWLEDPTDWTFPLEDAPDGAPQEPGTLVHCGRLLPAASSRLNQPAFVSRVLSEISMRHALALQQGLAIEVNERPLVPHPPTLMASAELEPISYVEMLRDSEGAEIEMRLFAGLTSGEEEDEEVDTDDPSLFTGGDAAGWYVFCNGRALLFANRGRLTGWGEEVPRFHPQYRRFRGFVYLSGESAAMPWNTAKTDVDEDSEIWAQTRHHIVDATRKSVTVMNRIKREVQQRPPDDRPLVRALESSRPAGLDDLRERRAYKVPDPPARIVSDVRKIAYSVSADAFERASTALDTDRASEIGQRTFRYWMRREVDADYDD
jgi:hypothetical protein